ncbi:MAG: tRNA (pseudouridine(54)-N(1))-methyltransferase TrmY [Halobacteriales archaeon]|nr:tRNA (pseudouridine(54)-N(1))-methyltransferase TrmY [Halobacteriales archaeon]
MTRDFVFAAHEAPTDAEFSLNDLPSAGRMDLLCRCVNAALLTSHGVREDTTARLVFVGGEHDVTVRIEGDEVRGLNPDERSIAGVVRAALDERTYYEVEARTGVYVAEKELEEVLDETEGETVLLHEDGDRASNVEPPDEPVFVLSDHLDFTEDELELLEERGARSVSLGPVALHADHATAVAHNWCDTGGWSYQP